MTYVLTFFHPFSMLLAACLAGLVAAYRQARSAVQSLRDEMARRRAIAHAHELMQTMSDRELADVGLHRGEVYRLAFGDRDRRGSRRPLGKA